MTRMEAPNGAVVEAMFPDRAQIRTALERHAALVFRDTGIDSPEAFEAFVRQISPDVAELKEESSPRHRVSGSVFTATDYPARYPIQFHTEFSYANEWPMRLYFGCLRAAEQGGETPIADTRRVLAALSPATRQRYLDKGLLYVRNYNGEAMGVRWQDAFGTSDRAVVEQHCRAHGIELEWGAGDALRTKQRGDAVYRHPSTGEPVWFNHGFVFNPLAIEPEELRSAIVDVYSEDEYSTNTYFGDGERIPPELVEEERAAYRSAAVAFPWQVGDVLLVENMLAAHARSPFIGARRIVVAMADKQTRSAVTPVRQLP